MCPWGHGDISSGKHPSLKQSQKERKKYFLKEMDRWLNTRHNQTSTQILKRPSHDRAETTMEEEIAKLEGNTPI